MAAGRIPIIQRIYNDMENELSITILALSEKWGVKPEVVVQRLERWRAERLIEFSQSGDQLQIKKTSLPAVREPQPQQKVILVEKEEEKPKFKITPPPHREEFPKPPSPIPKPQPPTRIETPIVERKPSPPEREVRTEPEPSKLSQTMEVAPPLPEPKHSWTWEGRITSIVLYMTAFTTISISIAINAWFGATMFEQPLAKVLGIAGGISVDFGKLIFFGAAMGLFSRQYYLAGTVTFGLWSLCLSLGIIAVLGFIATNQDQFESKNKAVVGNNSVIEETIKTLTTDIEELARQRATTKGTNARNALTKQISDKTKERLEHSRSLTTSKPVSSENPAIKFIEEAVNWITWSFFHIEMKDVSFAKAWLFTLCTELLPPIALFGAPLFWYENKRGVVSRKQRPL